MARTTVAQDRELVRGLKRKGYTSTQIANICNLPKNTVAYLLWRNVPEKKMKTDRDVVLATKPDKDMAAAAAEAASEAIAAAVTDAVVDTGSEGDFKTTISVPGATVERTYDIPLRFKISVGVVS